MSEPKPPQETQEPTPEPEPKGTDWKAEARKWEKLAKANKEKAEELDRMKEGEKSDLQKAQDAEAAAKKEAQALQEKLDRIEWVKNIAEKTGIPSEVIDLIAADSEEDLAEKAEKIKPQFATSEEPKPSVPVVLGAGNQKRVEEDKPTDWIRSALENK